MSKFLFLIVLSMYSLYAKDVIDKSGNCNINWTVGEIICYGESALRQKKFKAKRAAVIIAQRNLLEIVKGIQIDSDKTVKNSMVQSDIIRSSVQGVVKGAEVLSTKYNKKEKNAISKIRLKMGNDLLKALLSDHTQISWNQKISNIFSLFSNNLYANEIFTLKDEETLKKLQKEFKDPTTNKEMMNFIEQVLKDLSEKNYSGLLVDASDIPSFQKAMMAKLVDQNGNEVYPGTIASKDILIKNNGTASYDFDKNDAIENKKIFNSPLIIKPLSIYKNKKSDLVLDRVSIEKIKFLQDIVLRKAKVMILLGD